MLSRKALRTVCAAAPARAVAFRAAPSRSFAAAASASANEGRPPVAVFGVDGTYASALVCLPRRRIFSSYSGAGASMRSPACFFGRGGGEGLSELMDEEPAPDRDKEAPVAELSWRMETSKRRNKMTARGSALTYGPS